MTSGRACRSSHWDHAAIDLGTLSECASSPVDVAGIAVRRSTKNLRAWTDRTIDFCFKMMDGLLEEPLVANLPDPSAFNSLQPRMSNLRR